jgi:hypothetical protein
VGRCHLIRYTELFNDLPIVFREDGYINMTKAAKHFGKPLKEFFKNKATKEYFKAMEAMGGIPPIDLKQATRGGSVQGTYGHPKLAVFFARWLDVRFAVWCDLMIDNILKGNIQTTVVIPTGEAVDVNAVVAPLSTSLP